MATLDFVPIPIGARTASLELPMHGTAAAPIAIASSAVLTAIANDVNLPGWEYVSFKIGYVKGAETSLRGCVAFNGVAAGYKGPQTAGFAPLGADMFEITGSQTFWTPQVFCTGFQKATLQLIGNGGTTGTVYVVGVAGIRISARGA